MIVLCVRERQRQPECLCCVCDRETDKARDRAFVLCERETEQETESLCCV